MPYIRLPRPQASSEGQLINRSSVSDEGHPEAHNTCGVGSALPTSQERGHGGGRPSRNSGTAVYRIIYGSARSPGVTDYSLSLWPAPDQCWHHGGGFYFHRNYVFCGAHDYVRQMLSLPLHRWCRQLPWRRRGANICHQRLEHLNKRIADYYRDYCKTTAIIQQFSLPSTPKHNGLSERDGRTIMNVAWCMLNGAALPKSQPPAEQDYRRQHVVRQNIRQIRRPVLPIDCWDPSTWGPSRTSGANFVAHPIFSSPTVETTTLSSLVSVTFYTASATRKRQSLHQGACTFSLGGHPLQRSHLLRQQEGFAPSRAGQLQQSKQTPRDQVHGAPRLDRG